jgi:benzoyl-CoA reductase/2-hydroxyglutaryl-CoA dehydratase subunit BcrC/BadD/HgdB
VAASAAYTSRWIDTYSRSQIGYWALKEEPLYQMIDLLVVPQTDNNVRTIAGTFQYWTDIDVYMFAVPHAKTENGFGYYLDWLQRLRKRLQEITGSEIQEEALQKAIDAANRERELLQEISYMRTSERPPISGRDFIALNHASYLLDKATLIGILETLLDELKKREPPVPKGPRIMLTGSTLALGDNLLVDLLEETGATIVFEEFSEGVKQYWEKVETNGDPMKALATRYFMKRVPGAYFRPSMAERFSFLLEKAREFKVDGIVWYSLMYRDPYDIHGIRFADVVAKEMGIPYLHIESDYDTAETGPFRTRVDTFIETIRGRQS